MIKITTANAAKITDEIAKVQSRCRTRLCDYRDVLRAVELCELNPVLAILPKAKHVGTEGTYCPGERPTAKAYNGVAEETHIEIVRRSSGWFFVRAKRMACTSSERCNLRVPASSIEDAKRRFAATVIAKA